MADERTMEQRMTDLECLHIEVLAAMEEFGQAIKAPTEDAEDALATETLIRVQALKNHLRGLIGVA